jgi:hypothetical protein
MKMQTGEILLETLPTFHLRDRTRIMKWVMTEEFTNVMRLNDTSIKLFFEAAE